jgi:RND family efflux transporter MFP subunit
MAYNSPTLEESVPVNKPPSIDPLTEQVSDARSLAGLPRRYVIAGAAVITVLLLVTAFVHRHAKVPTLTELESAPLITALPPGRTAFTMSATFTGAIVARYDMPIGVDSDSGRISAILVEVGDVVHRGQVLARLDPAVIGAQVASLHAALEQARAEATLAQADYRRAAAIADSVGALSKEEVDRRHAQVATTAARVKAAEAQVAEVEARLGRTEIRAPADGVVLTRTAEIGQAVTPGVAPLFRMARGGDVEMRAQIAEQDLPKLKVGQEALVRVTGVDSAFKGTVRLLAAVIDPQTRLGEVRIALPHDANLKPGAFARGEVTVGHDVRPIIPQTALMSDAKGNYVLIVGADQRVLRRNVKVGGTQTGGIVIADGLDGTERVVTLAGAFLRVGQLVRLVASKETA